MKSLVELAKRAGLAFADTFLGLLAVSGILSGTGHAPAVSVLEQAALAGASSAISVVRNAIALVTPKMPSTLPSDVAAQPPAPIGTTDGSPPVPPKG